jgi:mannose-6-phosphate isomerase-like protein (cupin superfamily)
VPDAAAPIADPLSSRVGTWYRNPVTGEVAQVLAASGSSGRQRATVEGWLQPGAAVAGAHLHPHLIERFEVLDGRLAFSVGGVTREVLPGEDPIEVPAGVAHDWWNAGDGIAHARVDIEAAHGAPGAPVDRFVAMIETLWSLSALGRVNAKGMPDLLWLAAIATEFRDVLTFSRPPEGVQRAMFGPLAALARRRGRDPLDPELHGPTAPCVIPDPGEGLDMLLAGRVAAAAARGHR